MTFEVVNFEDIPEKHAKHRRKRNIHNHIKEFLAMNVKCVRVVCPPDDFRVTPHLLASLTGSIKAYGDPIDVIMRQGDIYLIRKDM